ncbi:MAG: redoxin domain-containing protein [Candidatus Aenigmarchaeota archaeon]|nr:redoxin domain-containing protein [Candidatus Aenigmarchaeota archaeon]
MSEKFQPPLEVRTLVILSEGETQPGGNAADFILEEINGTDIRSGKFIGQRALIIHFWSIESDNELTQLQTLRNFHGDEIEILGIGEDLNKSYATGLAKRLGITFPMLIDKTGEVKQAYRVSLSPTTYFISKDGLIIDKKEGSMTEQELNEKMKILTK